MLSFCPPFHSVRLQRVQQMQRSVAAHAKGVDADPILEQAVAILTEPEAAVRLPEQALAKKRKVLSVDLRRVEGF